MTRDRDSVDLDFPSSISQLNEPSTNPLVKLLKADTKDHKGDMFTKELDRVKFEKALSMIGMCRQSDLDRVIARHVARTARILDSPPISAQHA